MCLVEFNVFLPHPVHPALSRKVFNLQRFGVDLDGGCQSVFFIEHFFDIDHDRPQFLLDFTFAGVNFRHRVIIIDLDLDPANKYIDTKFKKDTSICTKINKALARTFSYYARSLPVSFRVKSKCYFIPSRFFLYLGEGVVQGSFTVFWMWVTFYAFGLIYATYLVSRRFSFRKQYLERDTRSNMHTVKTSLWTR